MNQHLGATYSLSVLIVVAFAIAFYRADPPPPNRRPAQGVAAREKQAERTTATAPPASSERPLTRTGMAADSHQKVEPRVTLGPPVESERAIPTSAVLTRKTTQEPVVRAVSRVRAVAKPLPRSAFTQVAAGETLGDVANRVYGSDEVIERLWKANRDQLPAADSPLRTGMLLRTP